jgi:hypothetical protein
MRFSARQSLEAAALAFCWRARVGPLGAVHVEDGLVEGSPVGRVRLFGLLPLAGAEPGAQLLKGNLQRYLAELPWNPDALLSNPALRWEAGGHRVLRVAATLSGVEGSVEFTLDGDGLPQRTFALRPAREGDTFVEREWHGEFGAYEECGGRRVPRRGRVAWTFEGERIEVWRGTVTHWALARG